MRRKFHGFGECRFGGSEKDRYFLKIRKWQHKRIWEYKQAKLASYFLVNGAKRCWYGLKISENIEIRVVKYVRLHWNSWQLNYYRIYDSYRNTEPPEKNYLFLLWSRRGERSSNKEKNLSWIFFPWLRRNERNTEIKKNFFYYDQGLVHVVLKWNYIFSLWWRRSKCSSFRDFFFIITA